MKSKKIILSTLTFIAAFCLPSLLFAQGGPGGNPDTPLDGGLSVLIAAGIGYGAKKVHDNRKKKMTTDSRQQTTDETL